jgi:hypothetical protein
MAEGRNEGIQISGGTINAGNLAVGRGATVVAELRERGQEDVARRLEELVRQLEEHRDEVPHLALVRAATESVTEELAKERPDKRRVRDVLAGISESVRSVTGLARAADGLLEAVQLVF